MSIEILEIQGTKASSLLPLNFSFEFEAYLATKSRVTRVGLIVSRNYRMVMYRDFQNIEEYIVSNLQYWVSWYSQGQWFILSFSAENSPKIPKTCWNFWKFAENFSKRRSFLRPKYRIVLRKKPYIVSILYRV